MQLPNAPSTTSRLLLSWRSGCSLIRWSIALLMVGLLCMESDAFAQELEPRKFSNVPVGMNFLIAGYGYATGSVLTDPSVPVEDGSVQTHATLLGYVRAIDVWGMSGKVDVILPYATVSGSAKFQGQDRERDVSGLGDARLSFSVNLYGAPALSFKEFSKYEQDVIVGASVQVTVPTGQYDDERLLNIGTNRWSIKPGIGASKRLGPLTLEFALEASFYADNNDYFGGKKRSQDPLYSVQGHAIYNLPYGIWVAVDGTYYTGGRSTVDGVENDDAQSNGRAGVTLALPVNRHNSVKLSASTGVFSRTGTDFDAVGLAWQYRWGGGL